MPAVINRISLRDSDPTGGLEFRVIFTEPVDISSIDINDFVVVGGSSTTVTSIQPVNADTDRIDVRVSGGDLDSFTGDVGIFLSDAATITTLSDSTNININDLPQAVNFGVVRLVNGAPTGDSPTTVAPETIVDITGGDNGGNNGGDSDTLVLDRVTLLSKEETSDDVLQFRVAFNEAAQNVSVEDFVVTGGSTATVTGVFTVNEGGNALYDVTVSGGDLADFNGTIGIALADSQDITDADGDALPTAEPVGRNLTYNVTNGGGETPGNGGGETPGNGGGETPGNGGGETPGNGGGETLPEASAQENFLKITNLGNAETLGFTFDFSEVSSIASVSFFKTDANGSNRELLDTVFSPETQDNVLSGFTPKSNILRDDLLGVEYLQIEYQEKGVITVGSFTELADGTFTAAFETGNQLNVAFNTTAPAPDVLIDDAESIDLTDQTGSLTISGSIHREAALNNVVDLYTTDTDGAVFDTMGNRLLPGDVGYQEAAIASRLNINLTGTNGQTDSFSATLTGGTHLGILVLIDGVDPATAQAGDILFSHSGANQAGLDHIKSLGDNTFGIEDQAGLGDMDFNDFVVSFNIA